MEIVKRTLVPTCAPKDIKAAVPIVVRFHTDQIDVMNCLDQISVKIETGDKQRVLTVYKRAAALITAYANANDEEKKSLEQLFDDLATQVLPETIIQLAALDEAQECVFEDGVAFTEYRHSLVDAVLNGRVN